jgi:hypothetical protein
MAARRSGGHAWRRCFFQHLLVTALHRAVALEQVDAVAERVGEYLDLDVARTLEVFLRQHLVVAEGTDRFALARGQRLLEVAVFSITRMPLPPPPADAFSSTG